ncbi:MAG: hypothetical protein EBW55_07640 [Betaproteobacteria bacterium]|nr:hypothetical protein [Betaproteobacteria bacterium]
MRSLAQLRGNANTSHVTTCHYKNLSASTAKLLIFLDRDAKTQPKTPLFRPQVSNFGGKSAIDIADQAALIAALEVLAQAVSAGELDGAIEVAVGQTRRGFKS